MGAALAAAPAARARFEAAREALGEDLLVAMFDGPLDTLTRTRYAQPAIFLTSVAASDLLREVGIAPAIVAGHSLGEYSALVAADVLEFADALVLVRERAEAMQDACDATPGTMAAILGLSVDQVREACEAAQSAGVVDVANINTEGQVVISGAPDAVEAASAEAKARGAKRAMPLNVGGAFHSRLMQPAQDRLAAALERTTFRPPTCAFIPNTAGRPLQEPGAIRVELARQLTAPVCWAQTMQELVRQGVDVALEVGPGKVLAGMAKRGLRTIPVHSVETPESIRIAAAEIGAPA